MQLILNETWWTLLESEQTDLFRDLEKHRHLHLHLLAGKDLLLDWTSMRDDLREHDNVFLFTIRKDSVVHLVVTSWNPLIKEHCHKIREYLLPRWIEFQERKIEA